MEINANYCVFKRGTLTFNNKIHLSIAYVVSYKFFFHLKQQYKLLFYLFVIKSNVFCKYSSIKLYKLTNWINLLFHY